MPQYVVLIYENESDYAALSPEGYGKVMDAHNRFAQEVVARGGKIAGGNALKGTETATSIRGDVVTDGPFVETKEALGGFYLIEADDLDQAIKIAGMVPAQFGGVEVRPVAVFPET
ncbi:MAG TPA: YciI family protein [Dermatophilaceae bacterium]|nr:YciI family protein [Dermatophilaceae bacterium]